MGRKLIYFNNSATTLIKPDGVYDAFVRASKTLSNMGRGVSALSIQTSRTVLDAREIAAGLFGITNPLRLGFTKNATEALNTGICGLLGKGDHVISTVCDHSSVLRPLFRLQKEQGVDVTLIPCDNRGELDTQDFEKALRFNTKMIVMPHASNVTGSVFDIAAIGALARKNGVLFFVDASQSAGVFPIDVQRDNVDLLAFTGHKYLFGLQGTGGLYVREGVSLRPLMLGGGTASPPDTGLKPDMPDALEAGTINTPGVVALARAIRFVQENWGEIQKKEAELTACFLEGIRKTPAFKVLGRQSGLKRTAVFSLASDSYDLQDVSEYLEERHNIVVRTGTQCAPLIHAYLGSGNAGVLRVSLSFFNRISEVETFMEGLRLFCR